MVRTFHMTEKVQRHWGRSKLSVLKDRKNTKETKVLKQEGSEVGESGQRYTM